MPSDGPEHDFLKLFDLDMLVLVGGRERTLPEWRDLLAGEGFELLPESEDGLLQARRPDRNATLCGESCVVAGGRGSRNRPRPRAHAAISTFSLPRGAVGGRIELHRIAPSGRSLLTGVLIAAAALGLYAAARGTSAFAVRHLEVAGAPPAVAAEVRRALAPALGESLFALDVDEIIRRSESLPMVAAATVDRDFPNTLRLLVRPEVPVAVLRQGSSSWLVAARGRVVSTLRTGERPRLPRLWLKRDVDVGLGGRLSGLPLRGVAAVAPLAARPLPVRVVAVVSTGEELTLMLRSGLELRLGDATELPLKLAVSRLVLPQLAGSSGYLDVSVPDRPVAGASNESQVEVEAPPSTLP